MSIKAHDAIQTARSCLGTAYSEMDCIALIRAVIRRSPGGDSDYRCQGTNWLWRSIDNAKKYRHLTWRQESLSGAQPGMLAFKRRGDDVHHVGLVTGEGTVIHSSSVYGRVVETLLAADEGWTLLGIHRDIEPGDSRAETDDETDDEEATAVLYRATVTTARDPLRVRALAKTGRILGHVPKGRTVDVLKDDGDGWPFIRFNELEGYASAAYLVPVSDTEEEIREEAGEKAPEAQKVTVIDS